MLFRFRPYSRDSGVRICVCCPRTHPHDDTTVPLGWGARAPCFFCHERRQAGGRQCGDASVPKMCKDMDVSEGVREGQLFIVMASSTAKISGFVV